MMDIFFIVSDFNFILVAYNTIMKNILYKITFAVMISSTLFSCTSIMDDYDVENVEENYYFNPPSWIHGKWVNEVEVDDPSLAIQFKTHDYLEYLAVMDMWQSFTERFREVEDMPGERVSVTEEVITTEEYRYKIEGAVGGFIRISYKKLSQNRMQIDYYDQQGNIIPEASSIWVKTNLF